MKTWDQMTAKEIEELQYNLVRCRVALREIANTEISFIVGPRNMADLEYMADRYYNAYENMKHIAREALKK